MYTYIKKNIRDLYIEFEEPISQELNGNDLGTTFTDYINGKWILLSDEQLAFKANHPTATVKEVIGMFLSSDPVGTLELAKEEKVAEVEAYDKSNNVNEFTINDNPMWLTVDERQQLATQINANEAIGRTSMTRWFGGQEFTFTITQWKQMLVALEVYAGDALNVTEAHKAAIEALDNIEDIEAYDFTVGYPLKLNIGNV